MKKTIATILYILLSLFLVVALFYPFQYIVNNTFTRTLAFLSFLSPFALYDWLKNFTKK